MEQEELPLVNEQPQPPVPTYPGLWAPELAPGFSVMQMELDGNCFYRSVSDQLFRDEGAGHVTFKGTEKNLRTFFCSMTATWN